MLDLHAVSGTPGAALVLGNNFSTIPAGDGQSVAGVPISMGATLVGWGGCSPTADTIANLKLQSQDQVDPINGELFTPGAASLLNNVFMTTNLPYSTGLRAITMGTNTGVVAALGALLDYYEGGPCIMGSRVMPNKVMTGVTTFGGALTTNTWGSQAYAPGTALPNGKYAILGAWASAIANAAWLRFSHADFGIAQPGIPVSNYETISTSTWDKVFKDDIFTSHPGYQFVYLSGLLDRPCVPVFSVTNAGTGLNIQAISVQTDTPVVNLNIARVA